MSSVVVGDGASAVMVDDISALVAGVSAAALGLVAIVDAFADVPLTPARVMIANTVKHNNSDCFSCALAKEEVCGL